jgi:hypothetical protein
MRSTAPPRRRPPGRVPGPKSARRFGSPGRDQPVATIGSGLAVPVRRSVAEPAKRRFGDVVTRREAGIRFKRAIFPTRMGPPCWGPSPWMIFAGDLRPRASPPSVVERPGAGCGLEQGLRGEAASPSCRRSGASKQARQRPHRDAGCAPCHLRPSPEPPPPERPRRPVELAPAALEEFAVGGRPSSRSASGPPRGPKGRAS